jgi:hypothetical protein
MAFKFNPFTGTLDEVSTGGGGGTPGGSDTYVQFNDGGSTFGGDVDFTWNKTTNVLGITGDVNLSDGIAGFTTTLQTITPTAARTISLPDATGTVALVAGSSGQLLWNNAGVNAGASTLTYDGSILTTSGRFINSYSSGSLAPAKAFTGTWATGFGATNTKPHLLIEPTGASSGSWSGSGTGLGVNSASTFSGNLLDLQKNGTSYFRVSSGGDASCLVLYAVSGSNSVAGINNTDGAGPIIHANANGKIGFFPGLSFSGGVDTYLSRDASGILAQRNGTNAQVFRVYNTFTSSTNYELGKLEWSSNVFRIGTEKGSGGGTARRMALIYDGNSWITHESGGVTRIWNDANNSTTNINGVGRISTSAGSVVLSPSDDAYPYGFSSAGVFSLGGTTTSFPALKRSSAILQARLADDSAYTTIDAQHRLQGTAPATASSTGTAGDVRYDTDYVYICTATNTWKRAALTTW